MNDSTKDIADRPARKTPFQFSLKHLFGLTFLVAVFLSILVGMYPFSVMMLPLVLFWFVATELLPFLLLPPSRRRRPNLAQSLVALVVIYALISFLASIFMNLRGAAEGSQCQNNLKQIALGLHIYHDRYGCFPPAYVADEQGRPMHSWRVLILPFVEHADIYAQYNFDEPWDGPSNRRLLSMKVPSVFRCPEDSGSPTATSYVAVVGPQTMWPGSACLKLGDIADGTSNTLMVVEIANSGVHWMEPRDLEFADLPMSVNPESGGGISSLHRYESWWPKRPYGANAVMADGAVSMLPTELSPEKLRALLVIDDNKPVDGWGSIDE